MTHWYERLDKDVTIGWFFVMRICSILKLTSEFYCSTITQLEQKPTLSTLVQFYLDLHMNVHEWQQISKTVKKDKWTACATPNILVTLRDLIVFVICLEDEVSTVDEFKNCINTHIFANSTINSKETENMKAIFILSFWRIAPEFFNVTKHKKKYRPRKMKSKGTSTMHDFFDDLLEYATIQPIDDAS